MYVDTHMLHVKDVKLQLVLLGVTVFCLLCSVLLTWMTQEKFIYPSNQKFVSVWQGGDVQAMMLEAKGLTCSGVDSDFKVNFPVFPRPKAFCKGQTLRSVSTNLALKTYLPHSNEKVKKLLSTSFTRVGKITFNHIIDDRK